MNLDKDKEKEKVVDTKKTTLQETTKKAPVDDVTKKAAAVKKTTTAKTVKKTEPVVDIVDPKTIEKKSWKYIYDTNSISEERLNRVALIDMQRKYTYRQMFRNWEKYAEVFSALNITGENHSRLAIFDCTCVETSFALYAANMTGASVAGFSQSGVTEQYPLDNAIKTEKITDLFINDLAITDKVLTRILKKKKELGINNIIIVRVPIKSDNMDPDIIRFSNENYKALRKVQGALFMEDLLAQYEATPIKYGPDESKDDAFIIHTSGTTKGIPKPVPLSDIALNAAAENAKISGFFKQFEGGAVSMCTFIASAVYGLVNQLHEPLAFGCSVVIIPMNVSNPTYAQSIGNYKVNVLFAATIVFDIWSRAPKEFVPDFTTVKCVVCGGTYLSAQAKKRYTKFMQEHGGNPELINGYGMSETGGACIIQTGDCQTDSIGFPLPGVGVKIYDENDEKYYDIKDKHTGVLYITSKSISKGKIDDETYFELEEIDGVPYICTNDVVCVNEDGSLSCQGRANRYFVNNDGVKFNAGIVENSIGSEPGIEACAITPWYDKMLTHDTVPVLYVQTCEKEKEVDIVTDALINVFITNQKAKETNLPMQVVFVDEIPRNANGKVDIYKITNGGVSGDRYIVRTTRENNELTNVQLEFVESEEELWTNGETPLELNSVIQDVMSTAQDDTVLNKAGDLLNEKVMQEFGQTQMMQNMPQYEIFEQLMSQMQNIGMQTYNFVSHFLTMMQEMNEEQRRYMEEFKAKADKYPQMPNTQEESTQPIGSRKPLTNYVPMYMPPKE